MTRPPGDQVRLDKIEARQRLALMNAERSSGWRLGPAIPFLLGTNIMWIGSAIALFLDWRWLLAGFIIGLPNALIGLSWMGSQSNKE